MKIPVDEGDEEIYVEVEVKCDDCMRQLYVRLVEYHNGTIYVRVDKCQHCTDDSYRDGLEEGENR